MTWRKTGMLARQLDTTKLNLIVYQAGTRDGQTGYLPPEVSLCEVHRRQPSKPIPHQTNGRLGEFQGPARIGSRWNYPQPLIPQACPAKASRSIPQPQPLASSPIRTRRTIACYPIQQTTRHILFRPERFGQLYRKGQGKADMSSIDIL